MSSTLRNKGKVPISPENHVFERPAVPMLWSKHKVTLVSTTGLVSGYHSGQQTLTWN